MANRYVAEVGANALRLRREFVIAFPGERPKRGRKGTGGGGSSAGMAVDHVRGQVETWTAVSRRRMRWQFDCLPWEMLGLRPIMLTLTYPAAWRDYCPDARTLKRHMQRFRDLWRYKFGSAPVGVWVVEFQPRANRPEAERGAPHVHLYVGTPEAVSADAYDRLRRRTVRRKLMEQRLGTYEARSRVRAIDGEFGLWLRDAWCRSVGTKGRAIDEDGQRTERRHHVRGVDVSVAFHTEKAAAETNPMKVAEYFWMESGKWGQKAVPEGFGSLRFWGRWGGKRGFVPSASEAELREAPFFRARRVVARYVQGQRVEMRAFQGARRAKLPLEVREALPKDAKKVWRDWRTGEVLTRRRRVRRYQKLFRGRDGLTAYGLGRGEAVRLLRWAEMG